MTMYWRFGASVVASLGSMYLLAFSQIDQLAHFKGSVSVLSMISAMGLIVAMSSMLKNRRLNLALYALSGLPSAPSAPAGSRRSSVTTPSSAR